MLATINKNPLTLKSNFQATETKKSWQSNLGKGRDDKAIERNTY
jgi:hypothetical protein